MKVCACTVDALVNYEMALHIKTLAPKGIEEETLFNEIEDVENLTYTHYVMDAGLQGDFLYMMAALAPCIMGYGENCLRLKADMNADKPYKEWINTHAGAEYQDVCTNVGTIMDAAIKRRLGVMSASPRATFLQERFTLATRLEVGFWQMGLNG